MRGHYPHDVGVRIHSLIRKGRAEEEISPIAAEGRGDYGNGDYEPDAGSDVASVSTVARRVNDRYVINGSKMFITNGSIADYLVLLCVTNEEEKVKTKSHSAIIIETESKGV